MALEQLTLRNFQIHKKLRIEFDPHVTTLIGASDTGKSAVVRALKWLATNRPAGDAFIHSGERECTVILRLDGTKISHIRGVGVNTYSVGDGSNAEAFGTGVPDAVSKLLAVAEQNFQSQHDSPFWFSLSAGEVSRQLNSIINLGIIDSTLGYLASRLREAGSRATVCEDRLAASKARRDELAPIREIDAQLQEVERLKTKLEEIAQESARLGGLAREAAGIGLRGKSLATGLNSAKASILAGDRWGVSKAQAGGLSSLIQQAQELRVQAGRKIPSILPLESLDKKASEAREAYATLYFLTIEAKRCEAARDKATKDLVHFEKFFHTQMGNTCQLCGQKIQQ